MNGTLRADYAGDPIDIDDPTTLRFFNTDAFTIPAPGLFGTAPRNLIIGPGSRNLNMSLSKNVNFARSRGMYDSDPGKQRSQPGAVLRHRHCRELADVRTGHQRAPDAIGAAHHAVQILIMPRPSHATVRALVPLLVSGFILSTPASARQSLQQRRPSIPRRRRADLRQRRRSRRQGEHRPQPEAGGLHAPRRRQGADDQRVRLRGSAVGSAADGIHRPRPCSRY